MPVCMIHSKNCKKPSMFHGAVQLADTLTFQLGMRCLAGRLGRFFSLRWRVIFALCSLVVQQTGSGWAILGLKSNGAQLPPHPTLEPDVANGNNWHCTQTTVCFHSTFDNSIVSRVSSSMFHGAVQLADTLTFQLGMRCLASPN